ncbi:MAG: SIR2 family protein [Dehalococcoidia bacterium]
MPSIVQITQRVLSGEEVWRHTDGNYYFGQPGYADIYATYVPRVLNFLHRLKREIDQYYRPRPGRCTNYEDLYYVASQIHDSELEEYDNPAVQPLIEKIGPEIQPLLVDNENDGIQQWQLHELACESTNYIEDVARHSLDKDPTRTDHLNSLKDACLDSRLPSVDIFTLNYDTVLERCLQENGVQFADGFGDPENDVRYWKPDLFDQPFKVRLFKLHGSVNWFRFASDRGNWSDESIGIPPGGDIWHTRNRAGEMQRPIDGRPMLLAGTFNKMLQYTSGIYADLHYQFYRSLRHTRRLVVCGYGFGDKGINAQIIEWVDSSPDQRIIVVHPRPEELKRAARGAISQNWTHWASQDKMTVISRPVEETSWQDMWDSLFNTEG